jgi:hypothetical protein
MLLKDTSALLTSRKKDVFTASLFCLRGLDRIEIWIMEME